MTAASLECEIHKYDYLGAFFLGAEKHSILQGHIGRSRDDHTRQAQVHEVCNMKKKKLLVFLIIDVYIHMYLFSIKLCFVKTKVLLWNLFPVKIA